MSEDFCCKKNRVKAASLASTRERITSISERVSAKLELHEFARRVPAILLIVKFVAPHAEYSDLHEGQGFRVRVRTSNLCGTRLQPRRKWPGFETALSR